MSAFTRCFPKDVWRKLPHSIGGGGDYFEVDLDDFVWVGESSFIANKKRRKMNFNVTFTEDALTVAWKSTGSVAICKSTKTAGGMCASIFVLMLCRLSRSFRLH